MYSMLCYATCWTGFVGALALSDSTVCHLATPTPEVQVLGDGETKVYKTPEEVKALFPNAKWLDDKCKEVHFLFCASDLPAYGNSKMQINGWVFHHNLKVWQCVFTVQLNGVVDVELSVNPKTGIFSAKGIADNKFKDKTVCTFDLSAGQ